MKARLPQGMGGGGAPQICSSLHARHRRCRSRWSRLPRSLKRRNTPRPQGGGAVSATVTGKMEVKNIDIKPEVIDPDDAEMLGDLVAAAVNEALRAAANEKEEKLGAISGGMSLPGIL